jgi:hypothetical protein
MQSAYAFEHRPVPTVTWWTCCASGLGNCISCATIRFEGRRARNDRALLWRRRACRKYRNEKDLLCTDNLRRAVREMAKLKPTDRNHLPIDLPDRTVWPFKFFGKCWQMVQETKSGRTDLRLAPRPCRIQLRRGVSGVRLPRLR